MYFLTGPILTVDKMFCEDCGKELVESYLKTNYDVDICDTCRFDVLLSTLLHQCVVYGNISVFILSTTDSGLNPKLGPTKNYTKCIIYCLSCTVNRIIE